VSIVIIKHSAYSAPVTSCLSTALAFADRAFWLLRFVLQSWAVLVTTTLKESKDVWPVMLALISLTLNLTAPASLATAFLGPTKMQFAFRLVEMDG